MKMEKIRWDEDNLVIRSGTLMEIMDSLIQQEPQYTWEIKDGVVNLIPVASRDDVVRRLWETKIDHFAVEKGQDRLAVNKALADLPELKSLLAENGVELSFRNADMSNKTYLADLRFVNSDLRGILNDLGKKNGSNLWQIDRINQKKDRVEISY